MIRLAAAIAFLLLSTMVTFAVPPALPTEVLVVPAVGFGGRSPVAVDAVAMSLASSQWKAPKAGDKLTAPNGAERAWVAAPLKDGTIGIPPGGYAYVPVKSEKARVVVLHTKGNGMVYVNGEPRVGDVYGNGIVRLPVALREGVNDFLFSSSRGPTKIELFEPKAAAELDASDATFPDLRLGVPTASPGGS
ncbi:MAG: hypothetical protein U0792_16065 [Gemmataceae bacterium]